MSNPLTLLTQGSTFERVRDTVVWDVAGRTFRHHGSAVMWRNCHAPHEPITRTLQSVVTIEVAVRPPGQTVTRTDHFLEFAARFGDEVQFQPWQIDTLRRMGVLS